ncbi:MAG: hypothetical protein ACI92E_003051 [Oceanicoccus sp.]|jgi:hypothetical protein
MAKNNSRYTETADQRAQNKMLFLDHVDVIIGDRFIFQWFSRDVEVPKYIGIAPNVTYHEIFPPSHFQSVFKEHKICDQFNVALKQLKRPVDIRKSSTALMSNPVQILCQIKCIKVKRQLAGLLYTLTVPSISLRIPVLQSQQLVIK